MLPISPERPEALSKADEITQCGVIAVITIEALEHTLPVIHALLAGGVRAVELTLRTPVAFEAARLIRRAAPEILLGLGTVIRPDQVKKAVDMGADFAVAPGCNPRIMEAANREGLFFAPGIMTATDIEIAVEHGCRLLKFFPAETSGGLRHLESMVTPYEYLRLSFIPLGGCNLTNARDYLQSPIISAIGGSWLARPALIQSESWEEITRNARDITALIREVRQQPTVTTNS
ncbi:bifunctional 4-hydroxy-2-oxoglutarate aldolase/2-dehydro-3-deoxy-phosphogluconate aldolase [Dyadobacter jiangsuensis]